MLRKFRIPVALAALAALLALVGCGGAKSSAPPASHPAASQPAPAPAKAPLKFGIVTSRSGGFEPWGTDMLHGFEIGLDYATNGTREINGRKIELVVKDDQGKADVGKQMAIEAFEKDKVDMLFGNVSSGITLQILPLLEQYKKVMIVEPAAADDITGKAFTRYAFRTGSNTSQDALAGAVGAMKLGKKIAQLAPDYDWGHNSADAWEKVIKANGGAVEKDFFIPQETTDFLPYIRQIQALKPDVLIVSWSNATTGPKLFQQMSQLGLMKETKVTGGFADRRAMKSFTEANVGMVGMVKYYYTLPKNKANDYLVSEYQKRFQDAPELFSAGGMAAAIAAVTALQKTQGDADPEKLIPVMEGMSFESPKGTMTFRKEDHQALQDMYIAELKVQAPYSFPTPSLVVDLKPEETAPAVTARR